MCIVSSYYKNTFAGFSFTVVESLLLDKKKKNEDVAMGEKEEMCQNVCV